MRTKEIDKNTIVVFMDGRLDMAFLRGGLEDEFLDIINNEDTQEVIVDLEKVEYVSSSGLRVLINALRKMHAKEGVLKLSNVNEAVKKIFQAAQVMNLFEIYDDSDAALNV